jgi:hypothetical protein
MEIRYCDGTKYSKIYKDVYWGSHRGHSECFENRNAFIENYKIKKVLKSYAKKHMFELIYQRLTRESVNIDHCEYYDTGYSIIGITSHHCFPYQLETFKKYGFALIDPLYCLDQSTHMLEYFYRGFGCDEAERHDRKLHIIGI